MLDSTVVCRRALGCEWVVTDTDCKCGNACSLPYLLLTYVLSATK